MGERNGQLNEGLKVFVSYARADVDFPDQLVLALARTIGVSAGAAETAIADLTARVTDRAQGLQLPAFAAEAESAKAARRHGWSRICRSARSSAAMAVPIRL